MMAWLFATLLVLALGVVALVAAGRMGTLPPAERDRVPVDLPPGPLGPEHLRTVRFPLALRGYRMADVDALLDRIATQLQSEEPVTPTNDIG